MASSTTAAPDLSSRPFQLQVERVIPLSPEILYRAWTTEFDRWFAAAGVIVMRPEPGEPFFFEVQHAGQRHPHFGRFLALAENRSVEITWVTRGTLGAETVVKIDLIPSGTGTLLQLRHSGFPDQITCDQHAQAWPHVLEQLERAFTSPP